MRWIMNTKTTMGVIFNLWNFIYWLFPHRQKKSFRKTAKVGLRQIFQLSIFVVSREKCHNQSHWICNFGFFFSYIGFLHFLGEFERHCLRAIRILQCSSRHHLRTSRQSTLNWESWRLCRSNLTEWCERWLTCQQLISDIKHTWKNIFII